MTREGDPSGDELRRGLQDVTKQAVETLIHAPKTPFSCIFDGAPAVAIFEMNRGCVARTDIFQPLCPQHTISAEPIDDITFVVDLSLDAGWTKREGGEPLFVIDREVGVMTWEEWSAKENNS